MGKKQPSDNDRLDFKEEEVGEDKELKTKECVAELAGILANNPSLRTVDIERVKQRNQAFEDLIRSGYFL